MNKINLIGQRFGKLLVIQEAGRSIPKRLMWRCLCDCGAFAVIRSASLRNGSTKSCGCLQREITIKRNFIHGMRKTRFYSIYCNICSRCNNSKSTRYSRYGSRGIKNLWNSFEEFIKDMYPSYLEHIKEFGEIDTEIDRIDFNGHYEKSNCHWATIKEQARNKRNNHLITFNNKTFCMAEWAEKIGIKYNILNDRINKLKWPIERAFNTPVKR